MPFGEPKHKDLDGYLLGTHTDYINVWASVHDEDDLYLPVFLRNPIMKAVVKQISLKELLDKYKIPGLAMSYDVEFDDTQSWSARKQVNIYEYPETRNESILFDLWQNSKKNELKCTTTATDVGRVITKPIHEATQEWMKTLASLPDGKDKILIQTGPEHFFEYERLVTYPDNV